TVSRTRVYTGGDPSHNSVPGRGWTRSRPLRRPAGCRNPSKLVLARLIASLTGFNSNLRPTTVATRLLAGAVSRTARPTRSQAIELGLGHATPRYGLS